MMQGDAYSVPVVIKAKDGTVITPEMATRVEITIGHLTRQWPGVITFNEDTLAWEFPLTQQQSFRLSQGKQKTQVRVAFSNGWVVGGDGTDVRVLKSKSKSILPAAAQQEKAANIAFGAIFAEIGAITVVLGAGLPEMSSATKGQYLTNDGETAEWANVDVLPAMSSDTAGKMLTNDGKNPEWGGAVRWDVEQTLTDVNKQTARINIGAFPGKTLQYFIDTTTGSTHDNDIFAAHEYDVIFPGNTYSDDKLSNAGMEFPAYVMSDEILAQDYHQIRLLDNNGAVWNVIVNTSGKSVHDCSKIVEKQVMCVNFTQEDDGNWSADKNYGDAVALIEAGGMVYTKIDPGVVCFGVYSANREIDFIAQLVIPLFGATGFLWKQDGTINHVSTTIPVLTSNDTVLLYDEQTLTADEQAQARENIGAGTPYTLPIASPTQLGGVKPVAKTDAMTRNVGVDDNGGLYTEPAAWHVTITQTSADRPYATANKTPQEILAAYQAGYNVYALIIVKDSSGSRGVIAPFVTGNLTGDAPSFLFSTVLSFAILANVAKTFYATNMLEDGGWVVGSFDLAKEANIPSIPTALKNPYSLTVKVGSTTTTYDGSAAKTVVIADGSVTDEQVSSAVSTWLTAHPEATTTVQDGAVTSQKLNDDICSITEPLASEILVENASIDRRYADTANNLYHNSYAIETAGENIYKVPVKAGVLYTIIPYSPQFAVYCQSAVIKPPSETILGVWTGDAACLGTPSYVGKVDLVDRYSFSLAARTNKFRYAPPQDGYIVASYPADTGPMIFKGASPNEGFEEFLDDPKDDWTINTAPLYTITPAKSERMKARYGAKLSPTFSRAIRRAEYYQNIVSSSFQMVCIGDSLTFGSSVGIGNRYTDFLQAKLNISVLNWGHNGVTATDGLGMDVTASAGKGASGIIAQHLQRSLDKFIKGQNNAFESTLGTHYIFTVFLGTNDWINNAPLGSYGDTSDASTFFNGYKKLVARIRELYPNSALIFITPLAQYYNNLHYYQANAAGYSVLDYNLAIHEIAMMTRNAWVIDMTESAYIKEKASSPSGVYVDTVHIGRKAHILLAHELEKVVMNITMMNGYDYVKLNTVAATDSFAGQK